MNQQPAQTMLNAGALVSYSRGLAELHEHPGVMHLAGRPQEGNQAQPQIFKADVSLLLKGDGLLQEEVFGPTTIVIEVADRAQLAAALHGLRGQLTATLIGEAEELLEYRWLAESLQEKVGRILLNGYPTGVEVCEAMVHGGPYPATSDSRGTSVGTLAIDRFLRPVCFQNYPEALLPEALQNANPLGIRRLVDGEVSQSAL
jgi:NADP-dependent aldehyde dehydrogenase